jgi:hypothetical protein
VFHLAKFVEYDLGSSLVVDEEKREVHYIGKERQPRQRYKYGQLLIL